MYGQKNYNEVQGINGKYTIREIGCFLVSFCNLLKRFGTNVDPLTLNRIFRDRGIYIDVDDGIRDDLGWQTITAFNGHIVVSQVNNNGSVPPNKDAIVRIKARNQFGTHFCLVDSIRNGVVHIVDSWDGKVKPASAYGPVTGWATYINNTPQPVKPVPKPKYDGQTITIQPGWGISHAAKAAGFPDYASEPRWNAIAKLNGKSNHTQLKLSPGMRIKVGRYVAPPKPTPAPPKPAPKPITVKPNPTPVDPNIINVTIQPGWGVSHALQSVGYPKDAYSNSGNWEKTAQLNGKKLSDFGLIPGQVIKVHKYVEPVKKVETPTPEPVVPPTVQEPEVVSPTTFKDTLDKSVSGKYKAITHANVKDYGDDPQPDLYMPATVKVDVLGVFEKDGNKYYLTKKSAQNAWWFGIPESSLKLEELDAPEEDDEFDMDMTDIDEARHSSGTYNGRERVVAIVAKMRGLIISLFSIFSKNKKGDK